MTLHITPNITQQWHSNVSFPFFGYTPSQTPLQVIQHAHAESSSSQNRSAKLGFELIHNPLTPARQVVSAGQQQQQQLHQTVVGKFWLRQSFFEAPLGQTATIHSINHRWFHPQIH
ncbi:MAG: hypothetical protein NT172_20415 [Planctomycetota bacterium]|nr:hypothetical protein [Planctomycetota bacterium]